MPLGHFFAAETVCFLGFTGYLRQPQTPLGRAALRVLLRALEGLRFGVPAGGGRPRRRLGELVEALWDHRGDEVDPLAVRIFREALRLLRRAPHLARSLAGEAAEQEAFDWQVSRLAALEPALTRLPARGRRRRCASCWRSAAGGAARDVLLALADLRAEAADAVLPLLATAGLPAPGAGAGGAGVVARPARRRRCCASGCWRRVPMVRRAQSRRAAPPAAAAVGRPTCRTAAILRALRGHPSPQTEALLLLAARDWDPTYRAAAVSSLGWWEPMQRPDVLLTLQDARRDPARRCARRRGRRWRGWASGRRCCGSARR